MLSTGAFNALLKTLEEPPPRVKFIFATTEYHKIPDTILSRCQQYDFRLIPARELQAHLRAGRRRREASRSPTRRWPASPARRRAAPATRCRSSTRCSPSAATTVRDEDITALLGLIDRELLLAASRGGGRRATAWRLLDLVERLSDYGADYRNFARELLLHFREILLLKIAPDESALLAQLVPEERERLQPARRRVLGRGPAAHHRGAGQGRDRPAAGPGPAGHPGARPDEDGPAAAAGALRRAGGARRAAGRGRRCRRAVPRPRPAAAAPARAPLPRLRRRPDASRAAAAPAAPLRVGARSGTVAAPTTSWRRCMVRRRVAPVAGPAAAPRPRARAPGTSARWCSTRPSSPLAPDAHRPSTSDWRARPLGREDQGCGSPATAPPRRAGAAAPTPPPKQQATAHRGGLEGARGAGGARPLRRARSWTCAKPSQGRHQWRTRSAIPEAHEADAADAGARPAGDRGPARSRPARAAAWSRW